MLDEQRARELAARCLAAESADWDFPVRLSELPAIHDVGKAYFQFAGVPGPGPGPGQSIEDVELGGSGPVAVDLETGEAFLTGCDVVIDFLVRGLIR